LAALFAIPLVTTLRPVGQPVFDPDVWWHLRVGEWVVEHHATPAHDPLAVGQKPWVAYSWLYEVVLFGLHLAFGLAGIIVYRCALSVAVVAALFRLVFRRDRHFLRAIALTGAGALAIAPLFSERPWLITILFTLLTADVVIDLRAGRTSRFVWLQPLAFVVWANTHIQFVYGLAVLGLACAAPVLDRGLGRPPGQGESADSAAVCGSSAWRLLVILTAACALATLVNPYHFRVYGVVLEYAAQPGTYRYVNELKALEFREAADWVVLALAAAATFTLGRRRRLDTFEVLLLAAAGFLAFRSRRDLWLLVTASLAVLAATDRGPVPTAFHVRLTARRWAAAAVLLTVLGGVLWRIRDLREEHLQQTVARVFPERAAAVVKEKGYSGPLYNDFNWGGYLAWGLPDLEVSLDGRTNLHGDERILRIGNTWAGGPGWQNDPDLAAAGLVVADVQTPLAGLLLGDDRFRLEYEDDVARVFVRRAGGLAGTPPPP
jgi:hypothetical protein